ncbi:MAG: SDR family oxidoreductase [Bifidobacteriaceae bacterium]|jgi:NAD(P)-dependent dehydrogenase (short-subunit alcohol dehydrogenase family)|nr:SDR family oxidoreductase [Bifidobacteriaceae bacterium]
MQDLLKNKFAVVTGGSSGVGLASAALFANAGALVCIVGRNQTKLAGAADQIGHDCQWFSTDLAHEAGARSLAEYLRDLTPRGIDILFANAGSSNAEELLNTDEDSFDRVINANLKSAFFTILACQPLLASSASVILTSSVAYHRGTLGDPLYSAAKAAVRALGRSFAALPEFLDRTIRVNTLSLGAVSTPMTGGDQTREGALDAWASNNIPMRRWADANEAAGAALFLASPSSGYMTGAELAVDGGLAQV